MIEWSIHAQQASALDLTTIAIPGPARDPKSSQPLHWETEQSPHARPQIKDCSGIDLEHCATGV